MFGLTYLNQWMQRHYLAVCLATIIMMIIFFTLEASYVLYQRDLIDLGVLIERLIRQHVLVLLLFVISTVVCKILILVSVVVEHLFPYRWLSNYLLRRQKAKFANFIVRRLLYQLQLASLQMPKPESCPNYMQYVQAKEAAYLAVDIFRRDANGLLVQRFPNSNEQSDYFVLDEEERTLAEAGYKRINLKITEKVLKGLLKAPTVSNSA